MIALNTFIAKHLVASIALNTFITTHLVARIALNTFTRAHLVARVIDKDHGELRNPMISQARFVEMAQRVDSLVTLNPRFQLVLPGIHDCLLDRLLSTESGINSLMEEHVKHAATDVQLYCIANKII